MGNKKNIKNFTSLAVKFGTLMTPGLSILLILYSSLSGYLNRSKHYIAHSVSILFALINSSKSLSSLGDFSSYEIVYDSINQMPFLLAIEEMVKDPVFYTIFWTLSKVVNFRVAIALITYFSFLILFKAAFNFGIKKVGILIFIGFMFSWPIFSLSGHIIRQFLCTSILFYAISKAENNDKNFIYYLFLSSLTHTSSFLIITIVLITYYKLVWSFLKDFKFLTLFVILPVFVMPQIDVISNRFYMDTIDDGSLLRDDAYIFAIANVIFISFFLIYKRDKFSLIYFLFSVIGILILTNFNPFLFGRFQFYSYFFLAFLISKFIHRYVIIGLLFLLIILNDTLAKLNTSGYIFNFEWSNLIISFL